MKKQFPCFIAGFLCAMVLFGVVVSGGALITGPTNIQVSPISVMVNGEVFQPKDANGQPVDVFAYNGTTYAPLRALAEAYGLEVGYDKDKNLATVTDGKAVESPVTSGNNDNATKTAVNQDGEVVKYTSTPGWNISYGEEKIQIDLIQSTGPSLISNFFDLNMVRTLCGLDKISNQHIIEEYNNIAGQDNYCEYLVINEIIYANPAFIFETSGLFIAYNGPEKTFEFGYSPEVGR